MALLNSEAMRKLINNSLCSRPGIFKFVLLILVLMVDRFQSASSLKMGFVLYNSDDDRAEFGFVVLEEVLENTEIFFTDNGVAADGASFINTQESILRWTSPENEVVPAGTVVIISGDSGTNIGSTVNAQNAVGATSIPLNVNGDQIYAYNSSNGGSTPDTFFAAINNEGDAGEFQSNPSTAVVGANAFREGNLPVGLIVGETAIALVEVDNAKYDGSITTGTLEELLSAINTKENWVGSDETLQSLDFESLDVQITSSPTSSPTDAPTNTPTSKPTSKPTSTPSKSPTVTNAPTSNPSSNKFDNSGDIDDDQGEDNQNEDEVIGVVAGVSVTVFLMSLLIGFYVIKARNRGESGKILEVQLSKPGIPDVEQGKRKNRKGLVFSNFSSLVARRSTAMFGKSSKPTSSHYSLDDHNDNITANDQNVLEESTGGNPTFSDEVENDHTEQSQQLDIDSRKTNQILESPADVNEANLPGQISAGDMRRKTKQKSEKLKKLKIKKARPESSYMDRVQRSEEIGTRPESIFRPSSTYMRNAKKKSKRKKLKQKKEEGKIELTMDEI